MKAVCLVDEEQYSFQIVSEAAYSPASRKIEPDYQDSTTHSSWKIEIRLFLSKVLTGRLVRVLRVHVFYASSA